MLLETLLLGMVVSLIWVELMDVYPGGIIVPAYFALFFDQPISMAATLAVSFAALGVYRWLSRYLILFGKRRFVVLILLGALFSQIVRLMLPTLLPVSIDFQIIGWIIPGLLANNLEKQKWLPTLGSLFTAAGVIYGLVRIWVWLTA
jgi:poly-gamma-glutamate biosynthesis protein PgsC/CapC